MIKKIIDELNKENGSIYKKEILRKYKDNELLQRVLRMTYCKVTHTYGATMLNVPDYTSADPSSAQPLDWALDILEDRFQTRDVTGNDARDLVHLMLENLKEDDSFILEKILNRDLRINAGRSIINSIWGNLIKKPVYQRCALFTFDSIIPDKFDRKGDPKIKKGTSNNIHYPAILNLKADGTYREVQVTENEVNFQSRSGEVYEYPLLAKEFKDLKKGRYFGELTVILNEDNIDDILVATGEKDPKIAKAIQASYKKGNCILPRAIGNGMINSDDVPHDSIQMDLWEYVTEIEYSNAANKIKNTSKYSDKFNQLKVDIKDLKRVKIIESIEVQNYKEAIAHVSKWMQAGLEGGVLKNKDMVFRDGTNPEQLKMKLEISVEMVLDGFYPGKKGTRREATFGGIEFSNEEGTIVGRSSGFNDSQLEEMNANRDKYIGKICEIRFNDITRARGSDTYALSHPRFIEMRPDKNESDTLSKTFALKDMAMGIEDAMEKWQAKKISKEIDALG